MKTDISSQNISSKSTIFQKVNKKSKKFNPRTCLRPNFDFRSAAGSFWIKKLQTLKAKAKDIDEHERTQDGEIMQPFNS